VDPRIPFAVSSVAVAVFAALLAQAERRRGPEAAPKASEDGGGPRASVIAIFALAVLLAGVGFQVHFSLNTAPAWLRFATKEQLPQLMPVFWIGFNVAILPASWLPKRYGGMPMMALGATVGAAALYFAQNAATFEALVAAQLVAGAAWAIALCAAFTAAIEIGRSGREGLVTGVLFSVLAMAALARLAATSSGLSAQMSFANVPAAAWLVAAAVAAILVLRTR